MKQAQKLTRYNTMSLLLRNRERNQRVTTAQAEQKKHFPDMEEKFADSRKENRRYYDA